MFFSRFSGLAGWGSEFDRRKVETFGRRSEYIPASVGHVGFDQFPLRPPNDYGQLFSCSDLHIVLMWLP